jgi:hypothetical protein
MFAPVLKSGGSYKKVVGFHSQEYCANHSWEQKPAAFHRVLKCQSAEEVVPGDWKQQHCTNDITG